VHFKHTPSEMWIQNGFRSSHSMSDADSWPHCSTVCKVATALLLQTNVALSPGALPKLHGLCHQGPHLLMHVGCCLIDTQIIPTIIWFVALAVSLFKSPFIVHACCTDGLHVYSQVHSFCSMLVHENTFHSCGTPSFLRAGPTLSLSEG